MDTFEITNSTEGQRSQLREAGFVLERLDSVYWNVECEHKRSDELTELLDEIGLEYRLV